MEKCYCRTLIMIVAALVQTVDGFAILPLSKGNPSLMKLSRGKRKITRRIPHRHRSLSLKYAEEDDNNTPASDNDSTTSSSARTPIVAIPTENIRYESILNSQSEDTVVNDDSTVPSQPQDISDSIKEVLSAPVIPSEEKERVQRLILPPNIDKVNQFGAPGAASTAVPNSKSVDSDNVATKKYTRLYSKIDLGRRWRRLRPGQKFRFRLGIMSIAFVSLWNTVVVRNFSGFITGILTGAAATTTATGFGSILRRWFFHRGFQGIAAFGRSVAYGWAIFVAYPKMLDRRAKERRLKREEEALNQWRRYLKATSDEVVRLRKELSLLEGEIRTFRREILAIRAGRIESSAALSKNNNYADLDDNNTSHRNDFNNSGNESDRILREAIINEMAHLTRLRHDTRLALTNARKRWSEVRSKRPISHSKSALTYFDELELELDVAADFEDGGINVYNGNDDPLLMGF